MLKKEITPEIIENFFSGNDPQKYIISAEANFNDNLVYLIISDPEKGKYIETHTYSPFLWVKESILYDLYGGNKMKRIEASKKYGVTVKKLRVQNDDGITPSRLENGYKYIVSCKNSYYHLTNFFKEGGIDVFKKENSNSFIILKPVEQFLIQTGKRLFKGIEDYNDLHRFQFDLETEGLNGSTDSIFQIGMKDNRGYERVLETIGNTEQEKRDSERLNINEFFNVINQLKPDIISGYNSENFDWDYIYKRCDRLNIDISKVAKTLNKNSKIKRKPATVKLGGETEHYEQTYMWGYNILDIAHSVRRAQAINSDIKSWSLKYITKYSKIAKENRVYVDGNKIYSTWNDIVNDYAFNNINGDWYKITDKKPLIEGYSVVKGNFIVIRYLLDDLWETEEIDKIFNQAPFLLAKIIPTSYMRSSTMGTAGTWKLIMCAWSYENGLGIPELEKKREFTGGLSRLLNVGYIENLAKLDYAALYPKAELTWGIFPDLDISGVMTGILTYVVDTRDKYKFLMGKEKEKSKEISKKINEGNLTKEEIVKLKTEKKNHDALANLYDKKQLPVKILANSWFGSYGAPYLFNWGETNCAEETTCRGRQYLRLMVKIFSEKYGFKPSLLDTDGVNFAIPGNINDFKYIATGLHWKTIEYANKELIGLEAVLAEFNETYMIGRMGLDVDDIISSTINFSKKNYANKIDGKIKLVGNTIKSKKMPTYIEEFLDHGIKLLLGGKGYDFVNYYYEYIDKIYNYNIPLAKIASKSKIKITMDEYKKKATLKNIAGKPLPKQAHMELLKKAGLELKLGDVVYYVNTGTKKLDGDIKSVKNKETGKIELQLNCKLILADEIENNPDLTNEEYNVNKYLNAFNNRIKPLLICFNPEIRKKILIGIVKDKKTKLDRLETRYYYSNDDCILVSGMPDSPLDQDTYEELMTMEDKEIKFWVSVNKIPNNIDDIGLDWEYIKIDYFERLEKEREAGVKIEQEKLIDIFKRLDVEDYVKIYEHEIPDEILKIADINNDFYLVSKRFDNILFHFEKIFEFENYANERNVFYMSIVTDDLSKEEKYELWLEYIKDNNIIINVIDNTVSDYIFNEIDVANDTVKDNVEYVETNIINPEIEDEWNF